MGRKIENTQLHPIIFHISNGLGRSSMSPGRSDYEYSPGRSDISGMSSPEPDSPPPTPGILVFTW